MAESTQFAKSASAPARNRYQKLQNQAEMTPKQEERIRNKIAKIKNALAADKRFWGGQYHDGNGYRYLQPMLYLQLQDYKGAQRYFNWFAKTFEEDAGFPIFLFEWTVTLFKNNKLKEAEKKALETFLSNTYIFDKFLGKDFLDLAKSEMSNWEMKSLTESMKYSKNSDELLDFAKWLENFLSSERFLKVANEFFEIRQELENAEVGRKRTMLITREYSLLENFE